MFSDSNVPMIEVSSHPTLLSLRVFRREDGLALMQTRAGKAVVAQQHAHPEIAAFARKLPDTFAHPLTILAHENPNGDLEGVIGLLFTPGDLLRLLDSSNTEDHQGCDDAEQGERVFIPLGAISRMREHRKLGGEEADLREEAGELLLTLIRQGGHSWHDVLSEHPAPSPA